jgi:hypothetical protein
MSKRSWIAAIAFGLIAVTWLAWQGWTQVERYQGEKAGQRQQVAETEARDVYQCFQHLQHFVTPSFVVCLYEVAQADPDADRSNYDLQAQQEMAVWAYGMLLVGIASTIITGVGVIFVALTLHLTRITAKAAIAAAEQAGQANVVAQDSVAEARRIGEAQVRSYLSIKSCTLKRLDGNQVQAHLVVRNSGQSPAKRVTVFLRVNGGIRRRTDSENRRIMDRFTLRSNDPSAQFMNSTLFGSVPAGGERDINRDYVVKDFDLTADGADIRAIETVATVMVDIHSKSVFQRDDEETENVETWRGAIPGFFEVGSVIDLSPQWHSTSEDEPYPTYNPKRKEEGSE